MSIVVRQLGLTDYESTWRAMREFTENRNTETPDEIWMTEHPPVFTQGLGGRPEHVLDAGDIPIIATDRGGQVTYHGPGQLVAYVLLDLRRAGLGVRALVANLEQAVIDLVTPAGVDAKRKDKAPGVYVDGAKLAALGLRVRKHCSYHGLSLNVDMDLSPFERINPCGYAGLAVTDLKSLGLGGDLEHWGERLAGQLQAVFERAQ